MVLKLSPLSSALPASGPSWLPCTSLQGEVGFTDAVVISGSGSRGGPIGSNLFMMPSVSYKSTIRPQAASPADVPLAKRLAGKAALQGGTVSLVAEAVRSGLARPFTFQWRHHGKVMKGETNETVVVPMSPSMAYGEFSCTVLDADRADVSSAFRVRATGAAVDAQEETKPGLFSDSAYRASRGTANTSPSKGTIFPSCAPARDAVGCR